MNLFPIHIYKNLCALIFYGIFNILIHDALLNYKLHEGAFVFVPHTYYGHSMFIE